MIECASEGPPPQLRSKNGKKEEKKGEIGYHFGSRGGREAVMLSEGLRWKKEEEHGRKSKRIIVKALPTPSVLLKLT